MQLGFPVNHLQLFRGPPSTISALLHFSTIFTTHSNARIPETMATATATATTNDEEYDRPKAVKEFDDSKIGVKGLVDSGITTIPRFFVHPPETLSDLKSGSAVGSGPDFIPAIDLAGVDADHGRSVIVEQIRRASSTVGFFQIVNHGVPLGVLERAMASVKGFYEQPTDIKARLYTRERGIGVSYFSNLDLYHSKAASWRDTLLVRLGPNVVDEDEIPEIFRKEVIEWDREIKRLGELLAVLLCEGLGVEANRLKEMTCLEGRAMVGNYYPHCPQPDLTVGLACHTDPGVLTVVQQDHVGGLQVKYGGVYVDVKPLPGALVVNIGDLLQIISNEEYKSAEHRVLANPKNEARLSMTLFFNPGNRDSLYGPLPEITSAQKPAIYQHFSLGDFMTRFLGKELEGKSLANYYKL